MAPANLAQTASIVVLWTVFFLKMTRNPRSPTRELRRAREASMVSDIRALRLLTAVATEPDLRGVPRVNITRRTGSKPVKDARVAVVGLLLVLTATRAVAADQNLPNPLTLSQAVAIALANSSVLRTAQSRLDQASGRYAQSRALLLPQLEGYGYQAYLTMNLRGL